MNIYPDTSMAFRGSNSTSSPNLVQGAHSSSARPRLPVNIEQELRSSRAEQSSIQSPRVDHLMSPIRQTTSLSFLSTPSRFIQQLPASPASLLLSPALRRNDRERNLSDGSGVDRLSEDEQRFIEQIDRYFLERRQYLQDHIDLSMNTSRWILEHVIFYSVETLRRQAQVQSESSKAYLTPISALIMIFTIKSQQGLGVLWKGCFSSLILTSAETMSNNLINDLAPFNRPSMREKHAILKAISTFLLIPFYSVHFLRSIQSDLTIVNHWSPLTIFIEPFQRLLGIKTGFYARALPFWYLITLSIPYFAIRHILDQFLLQTLQPYQEKRMPQLDCQQSVYFETVDDIECQLIDTIPTLVNRSFLQIEAALFASFLSSLAVYPYETVMNRLFVQGTRTIVDNLESTTTTACIPVNTRYLGVFDCCRTIFESEGRWGRGFYKGVGFLVLKFGFIYAGAHFLKFLIERVAILYTQNTSELSKFHRYVLSNQEQQPGIDQMNNFQSMDS